MFVHAVHVIVLSVHEVKEVHEVARLILIAEVVCLLPSLVRLSCHYDLCLVVYVLP